MKKQLILHIGCEKTGTTSIQNTLAANRDTLLNQYGYYYPSSLGHKNHTKLAIYCCNENKNLTRFLPRGVSLEQFRKKLRQDFIAEINSTSADRVIISSEWLHPRLKEDDEFDRLKELFAGLFEEINVVIYLRRQDKLAMSLYSTSLKAGNFKRFSFPNVANGEKLPYALNFLEIYRRWKRCFMPDGIQVRVFDRNELYENDVVKDFLLAIGCQLDRISFYQDDNRSLNALGVRVMRALNLVLYGANKAIKPSVARKFRHSVAGYFSGHVRLATELECQQFLLYFQEVNSRLEQEYFKDTEIPIKLF